MQHLIQLLPDNIANQIAAGEVVQRPASVVKELLENSIDSGAGEVNLVIKDAGKALIQVTDNGCGMSLQDARMSFERHATSKIRNSEDLFNIRTLGFRGEALASIAAVAQVSMKTQLHEEELGTELVIEGSEIKSQEPVLSAPGTCISVKNLFFNVPARRNFLKSNPVETRHILNEFIRVALANPGVGLSFEHNSTTVYDLPAGDLRDRLGSLFGDDLKNHLIELGEDTPYTRIFGYVGSPAAARKARGEQFFFVNNRFIKSPYLNHAVNNAFEGLVPADKYPFYCLFIEIDPKHVDINIHPTKTEVKFDDERTIYSLMRSIIKKGLSTVHETPDIIFDDEDNMAEIIKATPPPKDEPMTIGQMRVQNRGGGGGSGSGSGKPDPRNWEKLFDLPENRNLRPKTDPATQPPLFQVPSTPKQKQEVPMFDEKESVAEGFIVQLQNRYMLSQMRTGLMVVDQNYAHQRILFEKFLAAGARPPMASQQLLFPKSLTFSPNDYSVLLQIEPQLRHLGFDLKEFGNSTFILYGVPAELTGVNVESLLEEVIAETRETGDSSVKDRVQRRLARAIAENGAIQPGKKLDTQEMRRLLDELFDCEHPGVSPTGKPTYKMMALEEFNQHFQRNQR